MTRMRWLDWMQVLRREGRHAGPLLPLLLCGAVLGGCRGESGKEGAAAGSFAGRRVLYVDSYDSSYPPNGEARAAFLRGIAGHGLGVDWAFLDEKSLVDSSRIAERAGRIAALFERMKPDVVVAADDPAMRFVVAPFLRRTNVPIVFIGVNWVAPRRTPWMTGQVEVEMIEQLVADLRTRSRGRRVGVLTASTVTDRKNLAVYRDMLGTDLVIARTVGTFAAWKEAFREMQDSVDVLVLRQNAGIADWDSLEAIRWTRKHTSIPTGSPNLHMSQFVLLTYAKLNEEFGSYAAETVLRILGGTPPSDIPVTRNTRMGIVVNLLLMRKLGVTFPSEVMANARCVPIPRGKVAFVNSYHRGYDWSDGIERGFLDALGVIDSVGRESYVQDGLEIRMFRMDAKRHPEESFQKARASEIHRQLQGWKPDVIVAADDDASKWLVVPYYKGGDVPVLFCGLNWDASAYGFPARNVTGMVEVAPVRQLIGWLSAHAKGKRIGYLGADVLSEAKELDAYRRILGIQFADGAMARTFEEWKDAYRRLQGSTDMLILLSMVGVRDWNDSAALAFVRSGSRIPTGTTARVVRRFAMIAFARVPEEQGLWSGDQVRQILAGIPVSGVPVASNARSTIFANPDLLDRIGIRLPASFLDTVFLAGESGER